MFCRQAVVSCLAAAIVLCQSPSLALAVSVDWVSVGDSGNAVDTRVMSDGTTGYGGVAYDYKIGKHEVTNAQYAEFLNATAQSDPNALYNSNMSLFGVTQNGSAGSFTYSTNSGHENRPVNFVSFYDSLRFANWLHNGQPTGAQGSSTTEDGAYSLSAAGIAANSITRNSGASIVLASEDEWYKAAYFDAVTASYNFFPAGTSALTNCATPQAGANLANCGFAVGELTDVGSYTGSASPYGTFDQGGNVWEWNESSIGGTERGFRGGVWDGDAASFLASSRRFYGGPSLAGDSLGFRLVNIPEPSTSILVGAGLAWLASSRKRQISR